MEIDPRHLDRTRDAYGDTSGARPLARELADKGRPAREALTFARRGGRHPLRGWDTGELAAEFREQRGHGGSWPRIRLPQWLALPVTGGGASARQGQALRSIAGLDGRP